MKALIRRKHEVVLETDGIEGIDWKTGVPLTNPEWSGGPYILVNDYDPDDPADDFDPTPARLKAKGTVQAPTAASEASQDPAAELQDTIVIDGVTYTRVT